MRERQEASRAQFEFGFVTRRDALKVQEEAVTMMPMLVGSVGVDRSDGGTHVALRVTSPRIHAIIGY